MPRKTRERELADQIAPLQAELDAVLRMKRDAENQKLVGRCFKFSNSYGGSDKRWWLYGKVVSVDEYWPHLITFQHTSEDQIEIKTDEVASSLGSGWTEIDADEFEKAWQDLMQTIIKIGRITQDVKGEVG